MAAFGFSPQSEDDYAPAPRNALLDAIRDAIEREYGHDTGEFVLRDGTQLWSAPIEALKYLKK